jgi:hypothetical protein
MRGGADLRHRGTAAKRRPNPRKTFPGGIVVALLVVAIASHSNPNQDPQLARRLRALSFGVFPVPQGAPEDWLAIEASLAATLDPLSPNVCNRGENQCVLSVVDEMARRLGPLAASCSHHAAFSLMYLRVTQEVAESTEVIWEDRQYLNHLDAVFAQLYFQASDAWAAGRSQDVPESWRIAFEAADERSVRGIGDLMLGMNAHISRDLPFALLEVGLSRPGHRSEESDFDAVNRILGAVQSDVIEEVAARFDASVASTVLPAVKLAPETVGKVIGVWRSRAWRDAERLLEASDAQRAAIAAEIDRDAARIARAIRRLAKYLPLTNGMELRREYCASDQDRPPAGEVTAVGGGGASAEVDRPSSDHGVDDLTDAEVLLDLLEGPEDR